MNRFIWLILFIGNIFCTAQGLESSLKNLQNKLQSLTNTLKPLSRKDDEASKVITVFYTTLGGNKESYQSFIDQIQSDLWEYSFDLKPLSDFKEGSKNEEKAIVLMHDTGSRLNMVTPNPKALALLFEKVSKPIFILYTFDDNPSSTGIQRGHLANSIAGKLVEKKDLNTFWFWTGSLPPSVGTAVNKTDGVDYKKQIDEIKKLLSEK